MRLGRPVEFVTTSFSGLFGMLEAGKIDTIANQITITEERRKKYAFTIPYVYDGAQLVVRKDNTSIHGVADLCGKRVVVNLGSNFEQILNRLDTEKCIEIVSYDSGIEQDVVIGRAAAFMMDRNSAVALIAESGLALKLAGKPVELLENAMPFRRDGEGPWPAGSGGPGPGGHGERWNPGRRFQGVVWYGYHPDQLTRSELIGFRRLCGMNLDLPYMLGLTSILLKYLPVTLFMAVVAALFALAIGLSLALIKVFRVRGLVGAADLTISFFRGTPSSGAAFSLLLRPATDLSDAEGDDGLLGCGCRPESSFRGLYGREHSRGDPRCGQEPDGSLVERGNDKDAGNAPYRAAPGRPWGVAAVDEQLH